MLDWYENLPEEEVPPEWMWPFSEQINNWFAEIKERRKDGSSSADDDRTEVPLTENEDPRIKALRAK